MRGVVLVIGSSAAVVLAATAIAAPTPSPGGGFGSAACLRGHWAANRVETNRVTHALVPAGGFEVKGKLYMQFQDGTYQYGTTRLVIENTIGEARLIAVGRFFSLHRYTARPGALTLTAGQRHLEWGNFTAIKNGRSYSVPGPAPSTASVPGGTVPFQCRGNTLRVRLPRFASLDWITLQRG